MVVRIKRKTKTYIASFILAMIVTVPIAIFTIIVLEKLDNKKVNMAVKYDIPIDPRIIYMEEKKE